MSLSQTAGERNYHCCYLLCAGAAEAQRTQWGLPPPPPPAGAAAADAPTAFRYLSQGERLRRRDGVDDAALLPQLSRALGAMGFTPEEQGALFGVVAAVLQLGNAKFRPKAANAESAEEEAELVASGEEAGSAAGRVAELLQVRPRGGAPTTLSDGSLERLSLTALSDGSLWRLSLAALSNGSLPTALCRWPRARSPRRCARTRSGCRTRRSSSG